MAHKYEDDTERHHSIYVIHQRVGNRADPSTDPVVYVGQTTFVRDGDRFYEHVTSNTDAGQPWHVSQLGLGLTYATNDESRWPFYPRKVEDCKSFTLLEVAAAEQYWYEHHGGLSNPNPLRNRCQPLTFATFSKYQNSSTYRGAQKGFPKNWVPKR